MSYFKRDELLAKALAYNSTQEDINALGEWYQQYGYRYWTGEHFVVQRGLFLKPIKRPIYGSVETSQLKPVQFITVGYRFAGSERPVRKPVKGTWDAKTNNFNMLLYFSCSCCGFRTKERTNFCSNCEAKMN